MKGGSGAAPNTLFDASKFKTRFACELKNFEPTNFLDKKQARTIDRFSQLAIVASDQAMKDAGLDKTLNDPDRAAAAGRAARRAALARYGLARFLHDWDRLLKEVTR